MGDVYNLVNTAKTKCSTSINSRYKWVAKTLGVTFVDPNSWMDWNFGRDGLHNNLRGARHLGQLYSRVCGIGRRRQQMRSE